MLHIVYSFLIALTSLTATGDTIEQFEFGESTRIQYSSQRREDRYQLYDGMEFYIQRLVIRGNEGRLSMGDRV